MTLLVIDLSSFLIIGVEHGGKETWLRSEGVKKLWQRSGEEI